MIEETSQETIAHLRGVNARLTADVRDLQEQLDQAAGARAALCLDAIEGRDRYRAETILRAALS